MTPRGTRITKNRKRRIGRSGSGVETLAHLFAVLEEGHVLLGHGTLAAGARVPPDTGRPVLDRKGTETAEFHPVATRERRRDLFQDGVDDMLDVTLIEMRVLLGD